MDQTGERERERQMTRMYKKKMKRGNYKKKLK